MASVEAEFQQLITLRTHAQYVAYVGVASVSMLIYDHLITLDDEIRMIWPAPWRLPKIAFFLSRYVSSSLLITFVLAFASTGVMQTVTLFTGERCIRDLTAAVTSCNNITKWGFWSQAFVDYAAQIIVLSRVSALYGHRKTAVISLVALYISIFIIGMVLVGQMYPLRRSTAAVVDIEIALGFPGCAWPSEPAPVYGLYVLSIIYQTIVIVLTICSMWNWRSQTSIRKSNPILWLLARDSLYYFFICFVLLLAFLILIKMPAMDGEMKNILDIPWAVVTCVSACRMMINMHGFHDKNQIYATSSSGTVPTLEPMSFRPGTPSPTPERPTENTQPPQNELIIEEIKLG